jgi:hypothetical protein
MNGGLLAEWWIVVSSNLVTQLTNHSMIGHISTIQIQSSEYQMSSDFEWSKVVRMRNGWDFGWFGIQAIRLKIRTILFRSNVQILSHGLDLEQWLEIRTMA